MRMNSGIILQGQGVNALGAMADGTRVAAMTNEVQRKNALADLYRTQGAGIAQGDQGALNALAGIDPMAAIGVQDQRQTMDARGLSMQATQQRMDILSKQEARAVQEFAAGLSAQQRAAEAAKIEDAVKMGMSIQDPQTWDTMMAQQAPDLVGQFDNRKAIANKYMSMAEILKQQQGPEPADEYQRYVQEEQAAGRQPLNRIDYAQAKKGSETVYGPDGQIILQRGGGARLPKTTEGEKSSAGYLSRMRAAEELLDGMGDTTRNIASYLVAGTNFEGLALSGEQERILQAQRDWVRAKLRKESGAVIGADEMAEEIRTYFPLPGEDPETSAQKRQSRKQAERQFEIMSGNAASQAERPKPDQPAGDIPDFSGMSPQDLGAIELDNLSDEALTAYIEATELSLKAGLKEMGGN